MDFLKKQYFFSALAIILGLAMADAHIISQVVTAAIWGGEHSAAQESCQFEHFERKQNRKHEKHDLRREYKQLKKVVAGGVDVIELPGVQFEMAIKDGLIASNGMANVKADEKNFVPGAMRAEGVASVAHSMVIAYREAASEGSHPTRVQDFWDTQRFPGKRGMVHGARYNLEFALMADGVAKDQVYSVLGTSAGVKRALNKIQQLKGHIIWFNSEHGVMEAMQRDHVGKGNPAYNPDAPTVTFGIVSSDSAYMENRNHKMHDQNGFKIKVVWTGHIMEFIYWGKSTNPKDGAMADAFLQQVASSDSTCLPAFKRSALGLTHIDLRDKMSQELLEHMPTSEQNLHKGLVMDAKFWAENQTRLTKQFEQWFKSNGHSKAKASY